MVWMTVDELAKYLKVSRKWVYTELRHNRIPAVKLSNRMWRFNAAEIDSWLAQK